MNSLSFLSLAAVSLLLLASGVSASDLRLLLTEMNKQMAGSNGQVYASSVATMDSSGFRNSATGAVGVADVNAILADRKPMAVDTAVNGGIFSETLLTVTVLDLINKEALPELTSSIRQALLPGGLPFTHQNSVGNPLTIKQLLTHTSGIKSEADLSGWTTAPGQQTGGGGATVTDLRTFCETLFLSTNGGTRAVNTEIFATNAIPGTTYQYSKANIALLGYIVQLAIGEKPALVSGPQTVGGLIQEFILAPLGMSNTYYLLPDGKVPSVQITMPQLKGRKIVELTSTGGATDALPIHAAYVADYMLITSASDVTKLLNALFVDTTSSFYAIGTIMRSNMLSVTDTTRPGVTHQGYGVVQFDTVSLCTTWQSASSSVQCPFSANRPVIGFVAVGQTATVVGMCTDAPSVTTTAAPVASTTHCSGATTAYRQTTSPRSPDNSYVVAAGAFDQLFIDRSLSEGNTITPETQSRSTFFGVMVFAGMLGVIFFVLLAAYFVEYIVQPAPIAGSVTADAYRRPPPRD